MGFGVFILLSILAAGSSSVLDPVDERCFQKCAARAGPNKFSCVGSHPSMTNCHTGLSQDNGTCCLSGKLYSLREMNRLIPGEGSNDGVDHTRLRGETCPLFVSKLVDEDWDDDDISNGCNDYTPTPHVLKYRNEGMGLEQLFRANSELFGFEQEGDLISLTCVNSNSSKHAWDKHWQAALVSTFYIGKKRLRDGFFSIQQSLANLDKIIGARCDQEDSSSFGKSSARPIADLSCTNYRHVAGSIPVCNTLQNDCSGQVDYRGLFEDTAESLLLVRAMKKAKDDLSSEQDKKVLQQQIGIILNNDPWLKADTFIETYQEAEEECVESYNGGGQALCDAFAPKGVCKAIKAQARETREKLAEVLDEYSYALQCFNNAKDANDCDTDRVRKALAKAPEFIAFPRPDPSSSIDQSIVSLRRTKALFANEQVALFECRQEYRGHIEAYRKVRNELIIGVSLTVLTAGLGSVAGGGATWVASARVAQNAGKALTMAQRVRMVAGTGAQIAKYAALALDTADLVRGVAEAVSKCSDSLDHIGTIAPPSSSSSSICPVGTRQYNGSHQTASFGSCMKSEGLGIALSVLPFIPAGVKEMLDRNTIKQARLMMNVADDFPLKRSQQEAIVSFLSAAKKDAAMRGSELLTHVEILKQADLPTELIEKLLKNSNLEANGDQIARALGRSGDDAIPNAVPDNFSNAAKADDAVDDAIDEAIDEVVSEGVDDAVDAAEHVGKQQPAPSPSASPPSPSTSPASLRLPDFPSSQQAAGSLTAETVADNLNKLDNLPARDGSTSYRIVAEAAEDGSRVDYHIVDNANDVVVGSGQRSLVNGEYGGGAIELATHAQGNGIGGQVNKAFYEMAPSGTKMLIDNGNTHSMVAFDRLAREVAESSTYKEILDSQGKKAAEAFMTEQVHKAAMDLAKNDPRNGVLWVNLLLKAGWDKIELIPTHFFRRRHQKWHYGFNLRMTKA